MKGTKKDMSMKLITEELKKILPGIKETDGEKDPTAYVKIFHPMSSYTAYITEYDPEERLAFGLVIGSGMETELGYISIDEMESVVVMGLKMERDLYYKAEKLSMIRKRGY